jgi:small GTP-binding protein
MGPTHVGKTNIIHRFLNNRFLGDYISGAKYSFDTTDYKIKDKIYRFQIWEQFGNIDFIHMGFFRGIRGLMLIYDICNPTSFEELTDWISKISDNLGNQRYTLAIIGNKKDLRLIKNKMCITEAQGMEFTREIQEKYKIHSFFLETSAKNDENIDLAFTQLFEETVS